MGETDQVEFFIEVNAADATDEELDIMTRQLLSDYQTNKDWTDPQGPPTADEKKERVIRGGSARYLSADTITGIQDSEIPDPALAVNYYGVGFRCLVDPESLNP